MEKIELEEVYLVLDIDGVLNSLDHFDYRGSSEGRKRREVLARKYNGRLFSEMLILDGHAVAKLYRLIVELNCKIIISSSWRENSTPEHFEFLFKEKGYPVPLGTVIGLTPIRDDIQEQKRGHEIKQWFDENNINGRYLIIDDDGESLFIEDQPLYQVNRRVGLTNYDVQEIKAFFGK